MTSRLSLSTIFTTPKKTLQRPKSLSTSTKVQAYIRTVTVMVEVGIATAVDTLMVIRMAEKEATHTVIAMVLAAAGTRMAEAIHMVTAKVKAVPLLLLRNSPVTKPSSQLRTRKKFTHMVAVGADASSTTSTARIIKEQRRISIRCLKKQGTVTVVAILTGIRTAATAGVTAMGIATAATLTGIRTVAKNTLERPAFL